ncbi:MAG: hypothetical protein M3119_06795 [Verrucomicrobiota bacterium]|nr:hypothetical protein [Verrucomicrobiota bacterium]
MRRLTMALAFSFIVSSACAQQQATAYDALKAVRQLNGGYLNRIISVTGVDGDPQPTKWNILVADRTAPGGVREIQVAGRRIISNQAPHGVVGSASNATFAASKLNLDSSGAFQVASHTADQSHQNFDRINYTLRTNEQHLPIWIVTLQDQTRRPLGTIQINANRGNVVRVEGLYHGANIAHVEEDRRDRIAREDVQQTPADDEHVDSSSDEGIEESDEDENVIKRRIKGMFHRTKDDAAAMFHRVRRSFADFIAGDRD